MAKSVWFYYGIYVSSNSLLCESGMDKVVDLAKGYPVQFADVIVSMDSIDGLYILSNNPLAHGFSDKASVFSNAIKDWQNNNETIHKDPLLRILKRYLSPESKFITDEMSVFCFTHVLKKI